MKYILLIISIIVFIISVHVNNNAKPTDYNPNNTINDTIIYPDSIDVDNIITDTTQIDTFKVDNINVRDSLLGKLKSQLNVRETEPNRGEMIDIYNKSVNVPLGSPWCGAFTGYNLTYFNIPNPNSAWSPSYAKKEDIIWRPKIKNNIIPKTGDVLTLYYNSLGRVGHVGFYINKDKNGYFITIEGNTNESGSREGDGVFKKKRNPEKIHAISRYIND